MKQPKQSGSHVFGFSPMRLVLGALWLMFCLGATAAELVPGQMFPVLSLPDQHGESTEIGDDTEIVLFAADKPASDLLNGFLAEQGDDFLSSRKAAYIADISGMPGLISRMIALPRMRERPYRILLVEDSAQASFMPSREDAVTVVRLAKRRVEAVAFAADRASLAELLPSGSLESL